MYGKYVDSRSGEEYYKGNMKAGYFSARITANFDPITLSRNAYAISLLQINDLHIYFISFDIW